jgi:MinD-like ATPase involved in chromosome partitioning or flagellar assembly
MPPEAETIPVFSVVGTKGGTGKSTVSMGIAIWMSKLQNKWVLLIDGDIHVRTIEFKMCPSADVTLADVIEGKRAYEEAIYRCQLESDEGPLYPELAILPAGGRFLPPMRTDPLTFLEETKRIFDRMMTGLRKRFTHIIIDTPASMSFEHLILTAVADALIFVVEPNDDSLSSTLRTAKGLKDFMGAVPAGVVLNKLPKYENREKWVKEASSIAPVLWMIPSVEPYQMRAMEA